MGDCDCGGLGDCKTCGMRQFAKALIDISEKYKTKEEMDAEFAKLGVKKVGKGIYVVNL